MITECFLTPQVFGGNSFGKALCLLREIEERGVLVQIGRDQWRKALNENCTDKDLINFILIEMEKNGKIFKPSKTQIFSLKEDITQKNEEFWCQAVQEAKRLKTVDKDLISIATESIDGCREIGIGKLGKKSFRYSIQNEEALRGLSKILFHSLIATVCDPFCNLTIKDQYDRALELIAEMLQSKKEDKKLLVLHTKAPYNEDPNEVYKNTHKKKFQELSEKYKIDIELYVWKEEFLYIDNKTGKEKFRSSFHSRFLSTNIWHIGMDDGINIQNESNNKGASWSFLDDETVLGQLNELRCKCELVCSYIDNIWTDLPQKKSHF